MFTRFGYRHNKLLLKRRKYTYNTLVRSILSSIEIENTRTFGAIYRVNYVSSTTAISMILTSNAFFFLIYDK